MWEYRRNVLILSDIYFGIRQKNKTVFRNRHLSEFHAMTFDKVAILLPAFLVYLLCYMIDIFISQYYYA